MHPIFAVFLRFSAGFPRLTLALLAALAVGCRPTSDVSQGVELIPAHDPLTAASTFEVRFDAPMVAATAIGDTNAPPPVEVRPRLRAGFVWTSQRGGTFTPHEPLALGTAYTFTLRGGLTNAAGQPTPAQLRQTLSTPTFAFLDTAGVSHDEDCPATPALRLLFNAPVEAATAAPFLAFRSGAGQSIPASVTQGRLTDRYWGFNRSPRDSLSWEEVFAFVRSTNSFPTVGRDSTNPAPNVLLVQPRTPLPPGTNWALDLTAGLPLAGGHATLATGQRIELGEVVPFKLLVATAHNYINSGASLRLEFSKRLPLSLATNFAAWITVAPPVSNLTADIWSSRLALHGAFALGVPYTLTVRTGLPAADELRLAETVTDELTFQPIAPRLYFPTIEAGQFASGRRTFPLLVMNVDRVRIRAKLLDDASAIHGLRGFGRAYAPGFFPGEDGFHEVHPELIPGRTIYDETFPGTTAADAAVTLPLDWNRILGPGTNGAVFLWAERAETINPLMFLPGTNAPATPDQRRGFLVPAPNGLGVQALVQVSDLGLVWKTTADALLAFVFSLQTGQPIPAATVQLFTDENQALAQARTDASGLARLPLATNAVWLAARTPGDAFALEWRKARLPLWSLNIPRSYRDAATDEHLLTVFTDRDLYRPGETVHLKGVVRVWQDDALALPTNRLVGVTLRDYRDSLSLQTNLPLGAYGTFDCSFPLPADARQGRYDFLVSVGEASAWLGIRVMDFRPRAFEIKLGARPEYAPDEPTQIPVSARYLFGKPLGDVPVRWTIDYRDEALEAEAFPGFRFARGWRENSLGRGPTSGSTAGQTRLGGTNLATLDLDVGRNDLAPQPRQVTLAVEITDQNQQTLAQYAEFLRHSSTFYLGVKPDAEVHSASQPVHARAVALAATGQPWTNAVRVHLRLSRLDWQASRVQAAGQVRAYQSEPVVTNVLTREFDLAPARALPNGEWEAVELPEFTPDAPGEYLLELTATDPAGRSVACSESFYVDAPRQQLAWDYRNEVEIELVPDQPTYAPGDTATLLLKTPLSGTALVTVERAGVRRVFVTRLEGNAPSVKVPILPGDAPNVVVFVTLLRGAADATATVKEPEYRIGARNLLVADPAQRLRVALTPSATNYLPGATVEVEALVRDAADAPVPEAEVTLYAVDEGVLSLSGYQLPDLYAAFQTPRPIRVETGLSLPLLLPEDPALLRFQNKGYVAGGGGAESVRRNFAACACWHAALRTDAQGRVRVRFPAPDSLTRYRVLAVALTRSHQFGGAETPFAVSKPLLVEPALPAFARRTDQLTARAVVLNQTDSAGEVEVRLTLDATAKADALVRRVQVAPRGSAVVEFPVTFLATGSARWTWRANFTGPDAPAFTDAVESALNVLPPAPLLTERLAATATGPTNLLARANPQLLRGEGTLTVTLANSRLVALADAVPSLLHYPYGCAEQTASTLLPWVVLQATPTLAPLVAQGTNDADAAIRHGVRRLLDLRTTGGLAYWPGGREPLPWATAYATLVLALAQANGAALPESALPQLAKDLLEALPAALTNRDGVATGCLALYALAVAGDAQAAWHEQFFAQRGRLSSEARSLLALAIRLADGPEAMVNSLLREPPATQAATLMFGSPRREAALRLLAWVNFEPNAPEVGPLAESLVARLTEPGGTTTQEAAWTLLALSAYAAACEDELPALAGTLAWQGNSVPFEVDATNRLVRRQFPLRGDEAAPVLALAVPAGARLFTRVTLASAPPETRQVAQDHGFALSRTYTALGQTNQPVDLASLRVGDRVLVTLRIGVPRPSEFLAVDDPLPGILEPVLPEFRPVPGVALPFAEDRDGFVDFRELRADRALFFANAVAPGNYAVRYLARVRAAGTTTAPAAKVEAMYELDQFGLSASQVLIARPAE